MATRLAAGRRGSSGHLALLALIALALLVLATALLGKR